MLITFSLDLRKKSRWWAGMACESSWILIFFTNSITVTVYFAPHAHQPIDRYIQISVKNLGVCAIVTDKYESNEGKNLP